MLVTLMLVAPATTWLFVRTSPSAVSTMPVPAAAAPCRPSSVLTSTMAGSTFAATASASSTVVDALGCPEKPKFWLPPALGLFEAEMRCPMPSPATTASADRDDGDGQRANAAACAAAAARAAGSREGPVLAVVAVGGTLLAVVALRLGVLRRVRAPPLVTGLAVLVVVGLLVVVAAVRLLTVGLLVVALVALAVAVRVLAAALRSSVVLAHAQLQPSTSLRPFQETPLS